MSLAAIARRAAPVRRSLPEIVIAGIAGVMILFEVWVFDPGGWTAGRSLAGLTAAVSLAFLRRAPFAAFLGNGLSIYALVAIGFSSEFYQWTNLIALFAVAARASLMKSALSLALGLTGVGYYFLRFPDEGSAAVQVAVVAIYAAGWFAGRAQLARSTALEVRMDSELARADLAAQQARTELDAERTRVARELHDVVGHAVNVMVVHAGAGQGLQRNGHRDSDRAGEIFATIATTGRRALSDLDRMLDVLQGQPDPPAGAQRSPVPGVAELDELCASVRSTGVDVALNVAGRADTVGASVGLAAYRIVQEALTNVIKHAHATRVCIDVEVTVAPEGHDIVITVRDNGSGGFPVPGRGLGGIAARAAVHGGSAQYGPARGGGFEVSVRLPAGSAA